MNFYLQKYGFIEPQIKTSPSEDLEIVVVIPCFNEPDLIGSLESLANCDIPNCGIEVIVVINSGEHHDQPIKIKNRATYQGAKEWIESRSEEIDFHLLYFGDLPKKHAGVGLARKIGMDEAVHRFYMLDREGLIVCFDADAKVDPNYFKALKDHFDKNTKSPGCSIYYEHPVEGDTFSSEIYRGIEQYELHLRYYKEALKFCGLPYAFQTVGSSMAVRSTAYQKQGGMNKRKAGEDFYFLHKIIALGEFTELLETRVIPSPRISDRVPFGTGKAIGDWIETNAEIYLTYNFESFVLIKEFVRLIPDLYDEEYNLVINRLQHPKKELLVNFLNENNIESAIKEAQEHTKNKQGFIKRFYVWFDAFTVLKLVHHLRDEGLEDQSVFKEAQLLLNEVQPEFTGEKTLLDQFRKLERGD